ncbi:MAG: nuclear transport factor 2 family protein [Ignavibacteria bacterium]|nr:nuclear transport factor 2 family protein [Ignavibacteria bacterium]
MKKIIVAIILFLSVSCNSKGNFAEVKLNTVIPDGRNDSASIIRLENDWAEALINRDDQKFNQLLSDDFIYTENDKMYSRSEVLEFLMSPSETVEKAYNEDMQVRLYDKTAIVTGWLNVSGKGTEGLFKRKYRFTDIWHFINGQWQIVAAQDFLIP